MPTDCACCGKACKRWGTAGFRQHAAKGKGRRWRPPSVCDISNARPKRQFWSCCGLNRRCATLAHTPQLQCLHCTPGPSFKANGSLPENGVLSWPAFLVKCDTRRSWGLRSLLHRCSRRMTCTPHHSRQDRCAQLLKCPQNQRSILLHESIEQVLSIQLVVCMTCAGSRLCSMGQLLLEHDHHDSCLPLQCSPAASMQPAM